MSRSSTPAVPEQSGGFRCQGCSRVFPTKAGLGTHRRYCKQNAGGGDGGGGDGGGGPFDSLIKMHNLNAKEGKIYKRKVAHWLLLRKNRELRNGIRSFKAYRCHLGVNDINLKHRLKKAASSIIGCIQNDHSQCESYSFVCQSGADPYLYLLPHGRPISPMPVPVKAFIQESVNDIFFSPKLDRLLYRGGLRTTSHVEAVHRTIRAAAPKVQSLS